MESCGGKRRLSRHGAGWCLGRNSTVGQEGSLKACPGIATARTAQSVPKCTSASGLITPGKIYFPWEGATKRSWVLLTETPASPAGQKSRFALEQAVQLLFLQAAGCWFSSLLTHRSLQPPSRFSCERRCPGRSQKSPRFARCVLKPGTVRQCCGAEQGRIGFESLCSQQCSPTKCSVETASVI